MTFRHLYIAAVAVATLVACDDDTASLGIYAETDDVASTSQTFAVTTRSQRIERVQANTVKAYLGRVVDPETDSEIRAEFMAQFHTFENFTLPPLEQLKLDAEGFPVCDSVEVRLYFTNYYGDADNPMQLSVYELDRDNVLREDQTYFSTTAIADYIPAGAEPLARKTFAVEDYTLTDDERTSTTHNKNVRVVLPQAYGTELLRKAVEHPDYFADSWHFLRNVCPGFAFVLDSGLGTMLTLDVAALNVYFNYTKSDSTYVGIARFAATPEVIQTTTIANSDLQQLAQQQQPYTYLKSPAGLATEVTLPVDEVYEGHQRDSISRARVILQRYNSREQNTYSLGAPSAVLLVVKDSMDAFFDNRRVSDACTSYTTVFSSAFNSYTFTNLARMLSFMRATKLQGMEREGLTSEQWNAAHPDWNRAMLVPVVVKNTTNASTGTVTEVSVTHDFSLSSTRIVGGTQPIDMHVIYSRY
ncbi:MAG: DUF4270 domain-containing protein [Bacteroidaceae bacterium]|nr:DUF4270 domain-containing protein [Bacteroidaceae bacterium]